MANGRIIATGLHFPEGPVALPGDELLVVEIASGWITKVEAGGELQRLIRVGGGPNGLAIGPDGRGYVCNNGGMPASAAAELGFTLADTPSSPITPCVQAVTWADHVFNPSASPTAVLPLPNATMRPPVCSHASQ